MLRIIQCKMDGTLIMKEGLCHEENIPPIYFSLPGSRRQNTGYQSNVQRVVSVLELGSVRLALNNQYLIRTGFPNPSFSRGFNWAAPALYTVEIYFFVNKYIRSIEKYKVTLLQLNQPSKETIG